MTKIHPVEKETQVEFQKIIRPCFAPFQQKYSRANDYGFGSPKYTDSELECLAGFHDHDKTFALEMTWSPGQNVFIEYVRHLNTTRDYKSFIPITMFFPVAKKIAENLKLKAELVEEHHLYVDPACISLNGTCGKESADIITKSLFDLDNVLDVYLSSHPGSYESYALADRLLLKPRANTI